MTVWRALEKELDRWGNSGRVATFWWRDDDVTDASAPLTRLLNLAAACEVPITLAAVPADSTEGIARALEVWGDATVVQHGYAHRNHASAGDKKSELGPHRPAESILRELLAGQNRLAELVERRFLPVLAPPWNRIDAPLVSRLPEFGFIGLSVFGSEPAQATPGLRRVNTHIDIVDWRGTRGLQDSQRLVEASVAELVRRRGTVGGVLHPIGLLTHHLVHDPACWEFTEAFVGRIQAHPAARWLSAAECFGPRADLQ